MTTRRVKEFSSTPTMSEAQLQDAIIEAAHAFGYRVAHFRPARVMIHGVTTYRTPVSADGAGFPDLVLAKQDGKKSRVLFIECKSAKGQLSPEQQDWWRALMPHYYVFHPSDWLDDTIVKILRGEA